MLAGGEAVKGATQIAVVGDDWAAKTIVEGEAAEGNGDRWLAKTVAGSEAVEG